MPTEIEPELNNLAEIVICAAIEVHRSLGPGFLESVYEEALCTELILRRIPFVRQKAIGVSYKGHLIGEGRLDLLIDDCLVIELKAVEILLPIHTAQLLSYLKITNYRLGLLMNFNVSVLKQGLRRIVLT
ncbi:MAG: GxxExxY protein [Chitinophagaceae bacterium]|nr:GxxExxY protein [Anaerolineae bacterium]